MSFQEEIQEILEVPLSQVSQTELENIFMKIIGLVEIYPSVKFAFKSALTCILTTWGTLLERSGHYNKLFGLYHMALQVYPDHEGLLSNLGAHLLRSGYEEKASECFQASLSIDNKYLPALRNLETTFNMCVERWHFRMLNDCVRNSKFREAIIKKVKKGFDSVLDIGSGTGILSLFAVEAGAQQVYGCDVSKTMVNVSKKVLLLNKASEKVKIIPKLSHHLEIPSDIPSRVSLVITEILDDGLFGENILQTLLHAWDYLLLPHSNDIKMAHSKISIEPLTGSVIPHSADVWVAAVECNYIDMKYRVSAQSTNMNPNGQSHPTHHYLQEVMSLNFFAFDGNNYDSMDLQNVPGGFRFLTRPEIVARANFNDRKNIEQLLSGADDHDIRMFCHDKGRIDGFVLWFDLKLDEDIVLTSAPFDIEHRAKCWNQAIFPLHTPSCVKQNQILEVKVGCEGGEMSIKLYFPENIDLSTSHMQTPLPMNKIASNSSQHVIHSLQNLPNDPHTQTYPVSLDIISFLNDKLWLENLNDAFNLFLKMDIARYCINLLDLSPFPIFGLAFLVYQLKVEGECHCTLTCVALEEQDRAAINLTARANGIGEEFLLITDDELHDILGRGPEFDVILVHPIESSGKINEKCINHFPLLSQVLKPSGILLPCEIKICCQVINSQWLDEVSRVKENDRVCGYDIAPLINEYKVSEHLNFILSTSQHDIFTEVIETPAIPIKQLLVNVTDPMKFSVFSHIKYDGVANALPYWFKIKQLENTSEVSTISPCSFANQAVVLLDPQLEVKAWDPISITFTCHQGLLNANVKKQI